MTDGDLPRPRFPGSPALPGLGDQLRAAGYTADGILDALGPAAFAALGRGETVPALRATATAGPVGALAQLFVLQAPVAADRAEREVPGYATLLAAGLIQRDGDEVRAMVDIRPYAADDADFFVVSDLGTGIGGVTGSVRPDHVLGIGGASTTLAQLTVRPPVGRSLDLGTGCGVQALHLAQHATEVVATDRNPRALQLAALTAELSGVAFDLREGDLFGPVEHETFDLIVSNPPFVVSPGKRFTYRDSGLPGDEICRRLVAEAPTYLADGGWCQLLANWLHVEGQDWRERLAEWVVPTGCDAWVVQREVQDPMEYAELWLRDSGDHGTPAYPALYDAWLDSFAADQIEGVGFGWITLHRSGSAQPFTRIEELRQPVQQPLGAVVESWFGRRAALRSLDDAELLARTVAVDGGVRLEQESVLLPSGLTRVLQRVRQSGGLHRSGSLDDVGLAVLVACDGTRPLGESLADVARSAGLDPTDFVDGALDAVRALIEEGFVDLLP